MQWCEARCEAAAVMQRSHQLTLRVHDSHSIGTVAQVVGVRKAAMSGRGLCEAVQK